MNFHVLTLFPEMIMNGLETSILGRAAAKGIVSFEAVNIRDYTLERHGKVDDYPYGGGAGMVMQAEPIYRAYAALVEKIGKKPRVIYMTPQGQTFNQSIAEDLAKEEDLVFLCGHYEGVDERVLEMIATDYLSAGDYVLTGGELPAMMMIDCISRLVPGVLNNNGSAEFETGKETHAWFTGFAPAEDPKLVVTVLVEEAGSGGHVAAPIAKSIFDTYFSR